MPGCKAPENDATRIPEACYGVSGQHNRKPRSLSF